METRARPTGLHDVGLKTSQEKRHKASHTHNIPKGEVQTFKPSSWVKRSLV